MKRRKTRTTLIAIGLLGGILLGVLAPARADDDSLLETVREAFGKPRAELAPPVLIFPFMDDDQELTDDSSEWANIVTLAMVYGPQRRMSISVPYVKAILAVTNLVKSGTRVTNDGVRQCTAALGEPCYVLPITRESDQGVELELEFHGNGREFPDKTFRHRFTRDQVWATVEWSVTTLLEHVGYRMSEKGERHAFFSRKERDTHFFVRGSCENGQIRWTRTGFREGRSAGDMSVESRGGESKCGSGDFFWSSPGVVSETDRLKLPG